MAARSKSRKVAPEQTSFPGMKVPKEVFRGLRNYLAGQFMGATRDDVLLDEVLKCLFCKLYMETGAAASLSATSDGIETAKHVRKVFAAVRADFPDIYEDGTEILLDPEAVQLVMKECAFSLIDSASDPIGDAFEVFVGSESRGNSGQFFTPRPVTDLLVAAVDPRPGELVVDPACGAGGFLTSVTRHFVEQGVCARELPSLASKTIYGVDKDAYLVKLGKLHVSLLTGGHPKVTCGDSIAMSNGGGSGSLWKALPDEKFDVLLTNPPFGTKIVAASAEVLGSFALGRKWHLDKSTQRWAKSAEIQNRVPPQVLFVERCLSLLKEGGRMGMVVPESIVSNKSYRHVVEFLLEHAQIEGVIGMPEATFKTSGKGGTHTKTCLVIATKRTNGARRRKNLFMAEARWCGQDSRARSIPHNDLPEICERFEKFKKGRLGEPSALGFQIDAKAIRSNVLCPRYYDPEIERELAALEKTHKLVSVRELADDGVISVQTGDELGKLAYGTGEIPFIRTSDISNWELKSDPKHGVARSYFDSLRTKQDVRALDILMVKDGTYLIGTCAIVTDFDTEIVYQSHLYKIRVNEERNGLTPHLLLAVLSCPVVQRQVRAKQFTQDIIDSLGERLYELVLPIPRSKKQSEKVSEMVRESVDQRVRARELAREARLAVTA